MANLFSGIAYIALDITALRWPRSASIENVTLGVTLPQIEMLPNDFP